MNGGNRPDPERDFEEKWRAWSGRPPRKSAAFAAAEVKRRLRQGQTSDQRWRIPVAAAAAITLCGWLGVRLLNPPKPAPVPAPADVAAAAAPLDDGQVLIWLDSDTPLYMTYQNVTGGSR